ncbi:CinA family nicotinamide mononucleotide deamidase-related protein [Desulforhabdus amnigena]|jgi:nicotinamide-nucleotide amidase|uniref:CinA-like protein n=1 Tax=Desulforhabdus amnigena TaxID=40218 RepID=A0A9W6L8E8_9BACT|nr:CinA family nicotinamide mononucleotide deamidase-related protein [Desulforhabdus amnigena]NLJ28903.1 CinA family nicotinamide mononucleotide deamidase-related protein [Deltaproteobacteria bacterium]GLI35638.1 putative competence-damage inducible protein [Desulforhabdus amnigena]
MSNTQKTSEIVGSLLTIGDEILLGDIADSNSHYIAWELRARGFRLGRIITVGDQVEEIVEMISHCLLKSRFLIVTGGLGPTDDDKTSAASAIALGVPLVTHLDYRKWLEERLAQRGRDLSPEVARMADLPEGAVKLGQGMAGFFIEHQGIPCYFLPGVPHEMKTLLAELVIPDLEKRFPLRTRCMKRVIRVQGLLESEINQRLNDLDAREMAVEIGYYPQGRENWVTLFSTGESEKDCLERIDAAEAKVVARLGAERISGRNEETIEKVIGRQLLAKKWKLAVAESCTGGWVAKRITAVAGASDYFDRGFITYSNRAKMELLKVPGDLLESHGAVSEPVARAMAEGARLQAGVNVALAITGIAGPTGGTPEKPVGTVFISCATPEETLVEKHFFRGSREVIQESAAQTALVLLWRTLSK